jgi:hypothetical protein
MIEVKAGDWPEHCHKRFGGFRLSKGAFIMNNQTPAELSTEQVEELKRTERRDLSNKLDAVGWGLFFIWIGIAFLADVGFGVGLLGIGIIVLGEQAVRKYLDLKLEGFWIIAGLCFVVGGLWELLAVELPLVPILLIVAGIAILVSIFRGTHLLKK